MEEQSKRRKKQNYKKRIFIPLFLFLVALIFVGCIRVLIIVNTKAYENRTVENQMNSVMDKKIKANRGTIYDRNNEPLAVSSTVYTVALDTKALQEIIEKEKENKSKSMSESEKTITGLVSFIPKFPDNDKDRVRKNEKEIRALLNDSPSSWRVIANNVSFEVGEEIKNANLKCVYLETNTKRNYPSPYLAPQVIGFIRGDESWGLERIYNDYLTGTDGRRFNTFENDETIKTNDFEPIQGNSLITTLDSTIQNYADTICKNTFIDCKNSEHLAKYTALTVMNPNTGEILAMSQYPSFNLNQPEEILNADDISMPDNVLKEIEKIKKDSSLKVKEINEKVKNTETLAKQNLTWRNFNVSDYFEPGSIFKPIVVAMALEEKLITKTSTYFCSGSKNIAGTNIPCHKLSGHGAETLSEVLDNSCNVGMMEIGLKLGKDLLYKFEHDFGIGELTGIDLPAESDVSFYVPEPSKIGIVTLATESFGQGLCVSPIQALSSFSALINGGSVYKPYVVSQIVDANGKIVKKIEPETLKKPISRETSEFMRKSMQSVVETGTGKKAAIPGYSIGGKTGTAQQGDRETGGYTLTFMAYFPVEDPQYLALAIIHQPKDYSDGVVSPAPMIKELFQNIITYKSIPPSKSIDAEIEISENEVRMPDLSNKSVKEAINTLNALGISAFSVIGNGDIVDRQVPNAGDNIAKDTSSVLIFPKISDKTKKLIAVPDVIGLKFTEAQAALSAQGFEYIIAENEAEKKEEKSENETTSETANNSVVYEQIPAAGINLEKGTTIKLKIQ